MKAPRNQSDWIIRMVLAVVMALTATAMAREYWQKGQAQTDQAHMVEGAGTSVFGLDADRLRRHALGFKAFAVIVLALGWVFPFKLWTMRPKAGVPPTQTPSSCGSLSTMLLSWSKHDEWTVGHAVEGTLVLGATGSGKSSGSGRTIGYSFLRSGWGGLVLTAKADERRAWEHYCRDTGRSSDLIIFGPNELQRFDFLQYELSRPGAGAGITENLVSLFATILEVAERNSAGSGGREDEGYWRRANRQLMRNAIDLLVLATGNVSIPDLYRLVVSAPTSFEQLSSAEWKSRSLCFQCLADADKRNKSASQERDFAIVADYFMLEFPGLSDKTRSVIVSTFTSMVDVLNRGLLRDLFCTETNITPDVVQDGKIILIDLPVKEFAEVGQFCQVLWKYCFQRSIERRMVTAETKPVFLFCDEFQQFVTSYDAQFQATCRSARVATVYLTQNTSSVHAALGGNDKGRSEADALFGNFNTRIFHANSDPVTNDWASKLIGRTRQYFVNASNSRQSDDWITGVFGLGGNRQTSSGISEQYEFEVQPSVFTRLRTGGPQHDWQVDALVMQSGRKFKQSGRTWLLTTFAQKA